uniref:Ig-like domain-containing protein n=1 Tax=Oryzias latipes TaxID=8090 RepID=A0A3P9H1G4_ORYLA
NALGLSHMMLVCVSTGVDSIDLIQPDSKVVQPGQSLTISCQVSGYSLTDNILVPHVRGRR